MAVHVHHSPFQSSLLDIVQPCCVVPIFRGQHHRPSSATSRRRIVLISSRSTSNPRSEEKVYACSLVPIVSFVLSFAPWYWRCEIRPRVPALSQKASSGMGNGSWIWHLYGGEAPALPYACNPSMCDAQTRSAGIRDLSRVLYDTWPQRWFLNLALLIYGGKAPAWCGAWISKENVSLLIKLLCTLFLFRLSFRCCTTRW